MKRIALFGGSFNPPHPGHFEMARYIHAALAVDEVWFLFSQNWQKDASAYAPLADRMEMGRLLARHYGDEPFVMSDIQDKLGTHKTYEVLTALKKEYSDDRFVWVMGADNLASFHTWEHADDILQHFAVAVVDRPPYTEKALTSPSALKFGTLRVDDPKKLGEGPSGWCFLDNPKIDMSSSALLARLRQGEETFDGPFQEIADYIRRRGLYNLNA